MISDLSKDERYQLELYRSASLEGVCTLLLDNELTFVYGNDLFYKLHGCTGKDDMTGRACMDFIHPDDRERVKNKLAAAIKNGDSVVEWEMRIIGLDGVQRYVHVNDRIGVRDGEKIIDGYLIDITRQKLAEEELRQSEERFSIAIENSDVSFWTYDFGEKAIYTTASSRAKHMNKECVPDVPESLIASGYVREDSAEDFRKLYKEIAEGAKTSSADIWFRTIDDTDWWCEHIDYTNVFDDDGRPLRAYAVGKDVTATKDAEKKYQEEIEYESATQSDKLLSKGRADMTRNLVESYSAVDSARVFSAGISYDESIGRLVRECLEDKDREMLSHKMNRERVLKAFAAGDYVYSAEYRRKLNDGSVVWVNTTVKTYLNPEIKNIMSFIYTYDVNERKIKDGIINAVTELEYDYLAFIDLRRNKYKIYDSTSDNGHLIPNQSENYEESVYEVNKRTVAPEDVERSIEEMIPAGIIRNLKTQRVFSTMYSIYDDEHIVYRKRIQYAYLDEAAGQVVMTRTDVTDLMEEQKKQQDLLEAALLAAKQASSAKTEFLSRMSHEIRTPMNAIIGMSAIAAQSIGNDEEVADCISKIGISSRFLLSLINDILDMSRIESGKMLLKNDNIPFEEFVNGINSICFAQAQAKNIDYECTVAPDVEECYIGDAMKLQQVVMNVLSNAIKFTPEGGRVSMNISQRKRVKDNAELRFIINDTGCGISEKFIPHIFEPFAQENTGTTSHYGGTGLGLAISKNIVDMMNGQINVRSIVGVGTEFTVDVNLGITDDSRHKYRERASYNFTKLKALVVDDDVTVCEYTGIILKDMGVHFEWVDSGRKAIDKVTAKWKAKESFDLVLLDWKMPDMDGIETAREIRRIVGPDITIIIMTAYDWASIEREAKLAGVNLLMSKPMFKSSLTSAFEKVFGDRKDAEQDDIISNYDFTGKRVLLAEDHTLNVEVATKLLEHRGFIVEHAENGLRALEMFTTTPVGYYDAILMDIRMPQMDGLQAASNIRHCRKKDAKTVPIIAMTANAFEDDIEKSMAAGMNAHLAKPIEPDVLYSTLAQWIFRQ